MNAPPLSAPLKKRHPMLEARLFGLARRLREKNLHRRSTFDWWTVIGVGLAVLALRYFAGIGIGWAFPLVAVLIGVVVFRSWARARRTPLDFDAAAAVVEARHPDLELALRTAMELRAEAGAFSFLQKRVLARVLQHAADHDWNPRDPERLRWQRWHMASLLAALLVLAGIGTAERLAPGKRLEAPALYASTLTVTPGDAELERGTLAVVTARFTGRIPTEAALVWRDGSGATHRQAMAKSLSDPLFAHTLPPLERDLVYSVEYDGKASPEYTLRVFVLPALVRADAQLLFPEYTGLAPRMIAETRRVSAVEGTQLEYTFEMNKPLRRATLREDAGETVELTPANAERTRFSTRFPLQRSRRFLLELEDEQGRKNDPPIDIRVEALPNRRPDVRLTAPVGDTRVSPIEEVHLHATGRDEFGLLDYGIAFALGAEEPAYLSLRKDGAPPIEAAFSHLLALEPKQLSPGQLITWFAWADDFGPDGKLRRSSGDLHFAEVRPLDEIFREDESGGASSSEELSAGAEEAQDLVELQRQISLGIWKLKGQEPPPPTLAEDLDTLSQSQQHVRTQLADAVPEITEAGLQTAAAEALRHMDGALEDLGRANSPSPTEALASAWRQAQGAYQALLKLLPKESRVAQGNTRGGRGSSRGQQRQLDQLEFKDAENRYETETEAQPLTSPEQRQQLQALSKLRELARRQEAMNERLQELQTALAAARDEAQREQVQRELKRLEDEQRRLLADTDELREQVDRLPPSEQARQTREELERTRENMREAGDRLERGEVSTALASGTRAAEALESLRDDFRRGASSEFSEQLREARRAARELEEQQQAVGENLRQLAEGPRHSLDDSAEREEAAQSLEALRAAREALLQRLHTVAEDSETSEPGLHRRIYDLLRQHERGGAGEQLEAGAEMLRRGFVNEAREVQADAGQDVQKLRRGIERAAESVLGEEAAELRYAQEELDQLTKELQRERAVAENAEASRTRDDSAQPGLDASEAEEASRLASTSAEGGEIPGGEGDPAATETTSAANAGASPPGPWRPGDPVESQTLADGMQRLLNELSRGPAREPGPLTGAGFGEWIERLRTVEELAEMPEARQRLTAARERAEAFRRDFKRHSQVPQWGSVESGIAVPLDEARTLLRQELARREQPDALQPVDRDPVPDKYAEAVRKYYEALGQ